MINLLLYITYYIYVVMTYKLQFTLISDYSLRLRQSGVVLHRRLAGFDIGDITVG
jgi:hypothetical protein